MFETEYSKKDKINRRTFILVLIKLFAFFLLILRLFWLQIIESKKYKILSRKNRIRIIPISPIRGVINDSRGNVLATNQYGYRVIFDKKIVDNWKTILDKLFNILNTESDIKTLIINKISAYKGNKPITILDNINWSDLSLIEEHSSELEGIYIDTNIIRSYNFIPYLSHLIGYIGFVRNNSSDNKDIKEGIKGVEKAFDKTLRGNFGYKEIEVNAHGKFIKNLNILPSIKGSSVNLSIEARLQEKIYNILPRNNSIVILSNLKTGKINSLISKPSFDNSVFSNYIPKATWNKLINDPDSPLINRAIQSLYAPGSVFKIVTILAALEAGISEHTSFYCNGGPYIGNYFRCWNKNGHGVLDMESAIARSCNHYIYHLAEKLGHNNIIQMAKRLRLDQLSGIEDLGGEAKSFIPTPEWKKQKFKQKWNLSDTLNFCLGQGFVNLTPITLNQLISLVVNDGIIIIPSISNNTSPKTIETGLKKESFHFLKNSLFNVVNKPFGTAYRNRIISNNDNYMSGKTGTVQVVSKSHAKEDLNYGDYMRRNHSVFLGYYPSFNPKYAITVFVEHGGAGGNFAAEIAKNSFLIAESLKD
jgi:penicillin-binding protein 2